MNSATGDFFGGTTPATVGALRREPAPSVDQVEFVGRMWYPEPAPSTGAKTPAALSGIAPFEAAWMRLAGEHIGLSYPGAEFAVFDDLSFELNEPGFHAIFGPSGVGKTSLARIITGDIPAEGRVRTEDVSGILYCYNLERLPGWSSVGRHLERVSLPEKAERKEALIEAFGLAECMGARFQSLSLGQQNRVNLLRYLLQDFQVLIMDESLANVDEKTRGRILITIKALYPEAIFLYISHNVVEVSTYCRRILVLRDRYRSPRCLTIDGVDHRSATEPSRGQVEPVMLEIMNAA